MTTPDAGDKSVTPKGEPRRKIPGWLTAPATLIATACLAIGFGGGMIAGHGLGGHGKASALVENAAWPFFGRPRAANAARPAPARPEGFAVWKTRIDTTGLEPKACIQMSRPLDPSKSYADYVLLSPSSGSAPARASTAAITLPRARARRCGLAPRP